MRQLLKDVLLLTLLYMIYALAALAIYVIVIEVTVGWPEDTWRQLGDVLKEERDKLVNLKP